MVKKKITFNEFLDIKEKLEIRVGQIVSIERVPKSKKLCKLTVIFGYEESDSKTCLTNIFADVTIDLNYFISTSAFFITNLEPSKIMGIESEVMICPFVSGEFESVDVMELKLNSIIF